MENESYWIFGYGSLMWKVDFPYDEKVIGYVKGFERKFWQSSEDHRGVPGIPGRVATLIEKQGSTVWGVAYKLPNNEVSAIMQHLDHREKGGYKALKTLFYSRDEAVAPIELTIYIGSPDNPNFVGPESTNAISEVITNAVGPSGPNVEYLLNLVEYIKKNIPEDKDNHIFELECLVRAKIAIKKNEHAAEM